MAYKILSLDGGGIRGVLSARILKEIEATLQEKKGQKLHEYFDLIAGTSTGSILTGAIACQMNADTMIKFYLEEGKNIFLDWVRSQREWRWLTQIFNSSLLYPHEDGDRGLAKVLEKKLIHPELGSPKMCQITRPNILIPAYDVYSRNTTWFANNRPDVNLWYNNIPLWQICTASASAPTFFPPYKLPYNADQFLTHIDGGVSANNPALMAVAHALFIEKKNGLNLGDIAVLSVGTGNTTSPYQYKDMKNWGALNWVDKIPDIFLSPSEKNAEDIGYQIIESAGGTHLRLNFDLNERVKGERQPGRLRPLLKKGYNKYIARKKNIQKEICEAIDHPDNCQDLIEAAECYLDCGEVYYNYDLNLPVREAIQRFVDSH